MALDKAPPHLSNDEISIGFDAYSVSEIGKDEHGNSWPLAFESHSTYKSPLYAYLDIPFIKLLGRTESGLRMLSAVAGTAFVFMMILLSLNLGNQKLALLVGLLTAINPWNIYSSRMAYEANLGLTFFALGVWMVIRFAGSKKLGDLVVSGIGFGLSVWSYHTYWLLSPLLVLFLIWFYRKSFNGKKLFVFLGVTILVALPILLNFLGSLGKTTRASTEIWWRDNQLNIYLSESNDSKFKKGMVVAITPFFNYLQYVGFDYSFSKGLDLFEGREILDFGWFLPLTILIFILGLVKGEMVLGRGNYRILLGILLLTPIVPALTKGEVAQIRNLSFTMPVLLISGAGLYYLAKNYMKSFVMTSLGLLYCFFIFMLAYYVHFPRQAGDRFQYGYKQAWEKIKPNIDRYDWVIVEGRFGPYAQHTGVPHLYFGYFGAFDAKTMQTRRSDDTLGLVIGKYRFTGIEWNSEEIKEKSLYVASQFNPLTEKVADKLVKIDEVRLPNFKEQFYIYETK